MNLSSLLQFRDEWARFKARHPKFSPFLKAAYTRALREDSVISLKVTAPDGTEVASNFNHPSCIMSTYDTVLLL